MTPIDAGLQPAAVERDDVCSSITVQIAHLDGCRDVVRRVADRRCEDPACRLVEDGDPRRRPVSPVGRDDVRAAVTRHVADTDAVGIDLVADAIRRGRSEAAARELGEHADVRRGVELAGHHDDVVAPVAADVGDLEVVVPGVLDTGDVRCAKMACAVVEEDADGAGPPPDRGNVEPCVRIKIAEAELEAIGRRDQRRRPKRATGDLRKDLDPETRRAHDHIGEPIAGDITDGDRLERVRPGTGRCVRSDRAQAAVGLSRHDEDPIVGEAEVAGHDDVGSSVAGDVADGDCLTVASECDRLRRREERSESRQPRCRPRTGRQEPP